MITVAVTGVKETEARLRELRTNLPSLTERNVARGGLETLRVLKQHMRGPASADAFWGRGGVLQDGFLGRRSGNTADRLQGGQVIRVEDGAQTSVGSPDKYVAALEDGGAMTTAGWFRIPTAEAQTASGVDRLRGASFRSLAGGFLFTSTAGKLWGAIRNSAGVTILLYLFKKSIAPKGHHVFAASTREATPKVAAYLGNDVALAVRKANG